MSINNEYEALQKKCREFEDTKVKIVLFGQPGSGKSSLINAIVGESIAEVGQKTDTTRTAAQYEYEGIQFTDLPGYDTNNFPASTFFEKFNIDNFDLFLCIFNNKFHQADTEFFRRLRKNNKTCVFVRTKTDEIWQPNRSRAELEEEIAQDVCIQVEETVRVFFTSVRDRSGIGELVQYLLLQLDTLKKERLILAVKAETEDLLEQKKQVCAKLVVMYAGLAAANGINPIPGIDVSIDLGIVSKLFAEIRKTYGLDDDILKKYALLIPVANEILNYAVQAGLGAFLKKYAEKELVKRVSKYIPMVGPVIAATTGFAMVKLAGDQYLNDCHKLAEEILAKKMDES